MDQVEILEQIRQLVRDRLTQLGATADAGPSEAMLIRDGYFCGRRFRNDGLQAVWFMEESEIKFYDRDGGIVEVLAITPQVLGTTGSQRKAA